MGDTLTVSTFDSGTWGAMELDEDDQTQLNKMNAPEEMTGFTIAQWRVDIEEVLVRLNGGPWEYTVYVQRFAPRWLDATICATVLVRNFGSLMQLLTILRENDLTSVKPIDLAEQGAGATANG